MLQNCQRNMLPRYWKYLVKKLKPNSTSESLTIKTPGSFISSVVTQKSNFKILFHTQYTGNCYDYFTILCIHDIPTISSIQMCYIFSGNSVAKRFCISQKYERHDYSLFYGCLFQCYVFNYIVLCYPQREFMISTSTSYLRGYFEGVTCLFSNNKQELKTTRLYCSYTCTHTCKHANMHTHITCTHSVTHTDT